MTSDLLLAFKDFVDFVVEHVNKLMQSICVTMSARSTPTVIHGSNLETLAFRETDVNAESPVDLLRPQIGLNSHNNEEG